MNNYDLVEDYRNVLLKLDGCDKCPMRSECGYDYICNYICIDENVFHEIVMKKYE